MQSVHCVIAGVNCASADSITSATARWGLRVRLRHFLPAQAQFAIRGWNCLQGRGEYVAKQSCCNLARSCIDHSVAGGCPYAKRIVGACHTQQHSGDSLNMQPACRALSRRPPCRRGALALPANITSIGTVRADERSQECQGHGLLADIVGGSNSTGGCNRDKVPALAPCLLSALAPTTLAPASCLCDSPSFVQSAGTTCSSGKPSQQVSAICSMLGVLSAECWHHLQLW